VKLSIENVGKCYRGGLWALRQFTLELKPGVLGLLGPNGAGKTTLMSILATITRASEGRVLWNGADLAQEPNVLRRVLGYLPQDFGVYPNLNAQEFLEYLAAVKGLEAKIAQKRIDQLLDLVNLQDVRNRPLGGFSGGMKQRVGIAQALLNDPELLIVDEPTAGLDPEERVRFRNLLAELSGEREDLLRRVDGKVWEWVVPSADLNGVKEAYRVSSTARRSDGVHVRVLTEEPPRGAQPAAPTLEDAYLDALSLHRTRMGSGAAARAVTA